jgi:hypothetical protein
VSIASILETEAEAKARSQPDAELAAHLRQEVIFKLALLFACDHLRIATARAMSAQELAGRYLNAAEILTPPKAPS